MFVSVITTRYCIRPRLSNGLRSARRYDFRPSPVHHRLLHSLRRGVDHCRTVIHARPALRRRWRLRYRSWRCERKRARPSLVEGAPLEVADDARATRAPPAREAPRQPRGTVAARRRRAGWGAGARRFRACGQAVTLAAPGHAVSVSPFPEEQVRAAVARRAVYDRGRCDHAARRGGYGVAVERTRGWPE